MTESGYPSVYLVPTLRQLGVNRGLVSLRFPIVSKVDQMSSVSTHRTQKRPGRPRLAFVFPLLGSLGVALAAFQMIQPVREAFGLDPVVRPVTPSVASSRAEATEWPETRRFNRLASVQGVEPSARPVPMRRLGSGTRRAARLVPAPVQMASAGSASYPAVTSQYDAAQGPVQYAKLDDALRRLVDGDPAAPVRVLVQSQPGQQETTAQWLTTEGRAVHRLYPSLDALTATLWASDVATLSEEPSVARLSIDAVVIADDEEVTRGHILRDTPGLKRSGGQLQGGGSSCNADATNTQDGTRTGRCSAARTTGGTVALADLDQEDGTRGRLDRLLTGADRLPRLSSQPPLAWQHQQPELASGPVRLRELRLSDASSLSETLGCAKVAEHLSPRPTSVAEIEEFIVWTREARKAGRFICFGVIPQGSEDAVGVFQIWPIEPTFRTAEWGFALGHRFWGTGLFEAGARLATAFAFGTLGVLRLEARAAVDNVRGNAALKKLGAVPEAVLRKCLLANGEQRDHVMWSILAEEWRAANDDDAPQVTGAVA